MKKNMLIISSLLIIPFISSSVALSMEATDQVTPDAQQTINKNILLVELTEKFSENSNQAIINPTVVLHNTINPTIEHSLISDELNENHPVLAVLEPHSSPANSSIDLTTKKSTLVINDDYSATPIEYVIVDLQLPEKYTPKKIWPQQKTNATTEIPDIFSQSVILPKTQRPLSLFETFSYYTSSATTIMNGVIAQLENRTFDTSDSVAFDRLNEAFETAISQKDINALTKMATLCHEKYNTEIRINDETAKKVYNLVQPYYSNQNELLLKLSQNNKERWNNAAKKCKQSIENAILEYQTQIQPINNNGKLQKDDADCKKLKEELAIFAALNKTHRDSFANLLKDSEQKQPNTLFTKTMTLTTERFNSIVNGLETIPTLGDFHSNKTSILAIQNK